MKFKFRKNHLSFSSKVNFVMAKPLQVQFCWNKQRVARACQCYFRHHLWLAFHWQSPNTSDISTVPQDRQQINDIKKIKTFFPVPEMPLLLGPDCEPASSDDCWWNWRFHLTAIMAWFPLEFLHPCNRIRRPSNGDKPIYSDYMFDCADTLYANVLPMAGHAGSPNKIALIKNSSRELNPKFLIPLAKFVGTPVEE